MSCWIAFAIGVLAGWVCASIGVVVALALCAVAARPVPAYGGRDARP